MAGAAQAGRPLAAAAHVRTQVRLRERCPGCRAPSERGQLVCLGCGERLALEQKTPPGRPVIAAAAALAAVGVISLGFIAEALINGDSHGRAVAQAPPASAAAAPKAAPIGPAPARPRADAARRVVQEHARRQIAAAAGGWPAAQAGWTVVLLGAGDRDSAERFAVSLRGSGVEAGVISPERRPDLGSLWLVFSGVHPDQAGALAHATELRARYPGAFTRFVAMAPAYTAPTATTSGAPAQPPPG